MDQTSTKHIGLIKSLEKRLQTIQFHIKPLGTSLGHLIEQEKRFRRSGFPSYMTSLMANTGFSKHMIIQTRSWVEMTWLVQNFNHRKMSMSPKIIVPRMDISKIVNHPLIPRNMLMIPRSSLKKQLNFKYIIDIHFKKMERTYFELSGYSSLKQAFVSSLPKDVSMAMTIIEDSLKSIIILYLLHKDD
uniref:Uncharacterized protein n=1 Tax=Solanum lycopersicum TaxID=4081 RepID=A0A3Q7GHA2_SOLLC